jgi:hypothetical protein
MGNKKRNKLYIFSALILIIFSFSGCNHTTPVIIDGAKAREIENRINVLAFAEDLEMRGNTPSNIRNGGNLMMTDVFLFVIQEMQFNKDSSFYLQRISLSSIGSLSVRNDLISTLDGTLVAFKDDSLFYVENETSLASSFDVVSLRSTLLFPDPVSSFRVFDSTGYVSDKDSGDIYEVALDGTQQSQLLIEMGGVLLGIDNEMIYTIADKDEESVITGFDRTNGKKKFSLPGGPFVDAQIAGSFVFYKDGETLMKKLLDNSCECISASVLGVKEYAI